MPSKVCQWKPFWIPVGKSFKKSLLGGVDFRTVFLGLLHSTGHTDYIRDGHPPPSIYKWNPGPRRGKEDAFEKQIAGRWHVVTLQEASEYVGHDIPISRFHISHHAGCAILFNKDAFYPNIDVMSIYLHDTRRDLPDQIMEGEQGWVMQGVLSRASFRRPPVSGQKSFTVVVSTYQQHLRQEEKGIAKKLILTLRAITISQQVDLVAGDFNGTAWRCHSRNNISTIDEAFTDCALPSPPGHTPLWGPGSIPEQLGRRPADFSNHRVLNAFGKWVNMVHSPSHEELSPCDQLIKVAIMRHGFIWISSTGAILGNHKVNMIDEFSTKNVLRRLSKERRRGGSVIL